MIDTKILKGAVRLFDIADAGNDGEAREARKKAGLLLKRARNPKISALGNKIVRAMALDEKAAVMAERAYRAFSSAETATFRLEKTARGQKG